MQPIELTKNLIQYQSTSYHELELVQYISNLLSKAKIPHTVDEFSPHNYTHTQNELPKTANLYVDIGKSDKALMLYAHTDVVSAPKALFDPVIKNKKLYGRGTCDMKTALAGLVHVLLTSYEQIKQTDKRIIFAFVADEETSATGIKRFVEYYQTRVKDISCILMEPTNDFEQIHVGGRGYIFLDLEGKMKDILSSFRAIKQAKQQILGQYPDLQDGFKNSTIELTKISANDTAHDFLTVQGKACHASKPNLGINAIQQALSQYAQIDYMVSSKTEGPNSLPSKAYVVVDNQELANISATAHIDIRTNLAASKDDRLLKDVMKLISPNLEVRTRDRGNAFRVPDTFTNRITKGITTEKQIAQGGSDAPYVLELSKNIIPGFGPGKTKLAHTDEENIALVSIANTPKIILRLIENF